MDVKKIADYPLILLAGGQASRMGALKGLIEFNGRPWLIEQLSRYADVGGKRAVVVLGYQHVDYFAAIPWLEEAQEMWALNGELEVACVINDKPEQGQFSSIQFGAEFLLNQSECQGAFILPVDVPGSSFCKLISSMSMNLDVCVPVWEEQGGHPVLLSSGFLAHLASLPNGFQDSRLDIQIHKLLSQKVFRISVEDTSVVLNINSREDWKRFTA